MGLDCWFQSDVRRALVSSVVLAVETATAQGLGNVEHVGGILAGIKAVGLSFGIGWSLVVNDARIALGGGYDELLDAAGTRQIGSSKGNKTALSRRGQRR